MIVWLSLCSPSQMLLVAEKFLLSSWKARSPLEGARATWPLSLPVPQPEVPLEAEANETDLADPLPEVAEPVPD